MKVSSPLYGWTLDDEGQIRPRTQTEYEKMKTNGDSTTDGRVVKIGPDTYKRLRVLAEQNLRSISAMIRACLECYEGKRKPGE